DQQAAVGLQDGRPMKVVVLQGDSNDQMAREITAAVNSSLQKIENIDVVVSQPHPRWDANLAKSTMQQILSGKQKIDAVLANDSSLAVAAVEVLKQFGMERRVITVGAGAASKAVQAIMSGEHDAEIDNRPDMLAMAAYDAAVAMAQGRAFDYDIMVNNGDYTVPAKVVPPRLVQQDNVYLVQDRVEKKEQQDKDQQQNQNQQQQQQGQMGGQQQTTLRITTSEGKVVEVQIEGEVQSIQSQTGGMQQGQQ
ncbi:MAG: substrate-binding domain-containing protein, partial [Desulfotomaculum sp.]|nr:substrate-binding domain-containing protein [Desulfotomaculum sp.]